MKILCAFLMLISVFASSSAFAVDENCLSFIETLMKGNPGEIISLSDGNRVYTHFQKPRAGKPLYVLVNGLVYSTERWNPMVEELRKLGSGVLRYEFINQGKTLALQNKAIPRTSAQHAADLKEVIAHFRGDQTPVHLVGLSYGTTIASEYGKKFPKDLSSLTLVSPLVVSPEKYTQAGMMAHSSLGFSKFMGPMVYESMYESVFRNFFKTSIQASSHEQIPLARYQDGLYELSKAVRDYDLKTEMPLIQEVPVKLILGELETAEAKKDILRVAEILKKNPKAHFIEIPGAYHDVNYGKGVELAAELVKSPDKK